MCVYAVCLCMSLSVDVSCVPASMQLPISNYMSNTQCTLTPPFKAIQALYEVFMQTVIYSTTL